MTAVQPCLSGLPLPDGQPPEIPAPLRLERPGLRLCHHRRWLQRDETSASGLDHHLTHDLPWQQPEVVVYGRRHPTPRLCCWVADPGCAYRYSGLQQPITAWTPPLRALRHRLERDLSVRFNSLLLNRYRSGADRMGWHADDEAELDPAAPIASLSLGVSRTLRFRPRPGDALAAAEAAFVIDLADGDLLVMEPPTQAHWQHALPPRLRVRGERLNLTFRRIRRPL